MPDRCCFLPTGWLACVGAFLSISFVDATRAEWPEILPRASDVSAVVVASTTNSSVRGEDPFGADPPNSSPAPSYEWPVRKTVTDMKAVASFLKSIGRDLRSTTRSPAACGYARSFFLVSRDGRIVGAMHWQKESRLVEVESGGRWQVHDGVVRCVEWQDLKSWIGECSTSWPDAEWRR